MTTYRLNENWSSFEVGDKFKLSDYGNGDLYQLIDNSDNYVLARIPTDLLDEVGDSGGYWRPKRSDPYYYISNNVAIFGNTFDPVVDRADDNRLSIGNCFKTEKDAQAVVDWLRARQRLIDSGARFINTMGVDSSQGYYTIYYTIDRGDLVIEDAYIGENTVGDKKLYFDDRQLAYKSINEHRSAWLTYLGVKEKNDED